MIPFNKPYLVQPDQFSEELSLLRGFSGDKKFTRLCSELLEKKFSVPKVLLTPSCTDSLELAAIALDIGPGDEVIMPSFTFVSTANAFVLRGANVVFIDINPRTLNMDENLIEAAITKNTKAIVPVHYAGVACEMDKINELANRYGLKVVEDAAQAILSTYKDKPLGTLSNYGCFSFHETKNIHCGEGGAIFVNNTELIERSEIIREKGTNRSKFFRGQVDKYTWVDVGSSFLLSDLNAWYLYPQLLGLESIIADRMKSWNIYKDQLKGLEQRELIELSVIPEHCKHNAHLFSLKLKNLKQRDQLNHHLNQNGVNSAFHYVPLHSSPAGKKFGRFHGQDNFTTDSSERLLRLPLYFGLKEDEILKVVQTIESFFR